jgi:hypothetical protein
MSESPDLSLGSLAAGAGLIAALIAVGSLASGASWLGLGLLLIGAAAFVWGVRADIKELWVAALESGEYRQGEKALHYENWHCCLGVLCDLHAQETGSEWENRTVGGRSYLGESEVLPPEVTVWAGLDSDNPTVDDLYLADLNDDGTPFPNIAQLIREHL